MIIYYKYVSIIKINNFKFSVRYHLHDQGYKSVIPLRGGAENSHWPVWETS